jgi:SAM-dependent methyltransferase
MDYKQVAEVASRYGIAGSYGVEELEVFAKAFIDHVPPYSHVVEIGCQFGRSTAAILTIAQEFHYHVWCVDPFTFEETGGQDDVGAKFIRSMLTFNVPFATLAMRSYDAIDYAPSSIEAVHIDGDHSLGGVTQDCQLWLPRLVHGGLAICHDYGRCGAPDVQPVVDAYTQGWKVLETNGMWVGIKS